MIVSTRNVSYTYKMFEPIAIHLSERTTDKNASLRNADIMCTLQILLYMYLTNTHCSYAAQILHIAPYTYELCDQVHMIYV